MDKKFLVYPKWNRMGNLGNKLFQMSALYGVAKRWDREFIIPGKWDYQKYFTYQVPTTTVMAKFDEDINEPCYEFSGWEYWDRAKMELEDKQFIKIGGWLQSEKYWKHCENEIKSLLFNFEPTFKYELYERYSHIFENNKQTILISIRVGEDYVSNGNYEILDIKYQLSALYEFFPDWESKYNILVFSDNYQYAKLHLDCHESIFFADGLNDIQQLCLGTFCDHFILSNSTFCWWQAKLGEKKQSVIVRPSKYFKAYLAEISTTEDFWPKEWKSWDYKGKKFDFNDVCFTIPIKYDHKDRIANLKLTLNWIKTNFDCTIAIEEIYNSDTERKFDSKEFKWDIYKGHVWKHFHRTKMLNEMASFSMIKNIVVNFDCDNICSILQIKLGVDVIRRRETDMVYPYDGRVARVNREKWYNKLAETNGDVGIFGAEIFKGTRAIDPLSVGHIVIWNKEKFFEGGGENENFISYGPEDVERYERFEKLGFNIKRIKGIVYHIDHWCGPDSSGRNPNFGRNYEELDRVREMNKDELWEYVRSWSWYKKQSL